MVFRENSNNMHSTLAYYVSKLMSDLPFQSLYLFLFGTIVYWMVGYRQNGVNYIIFVALLILISNIGAGVGLFLSAWFKRRYCPVTIIPFMIFSGFLVNDNSVPDYFMGSYLSFIKWAFEALILNEFKDTTLNCNKGIWSCFWNRKRQMFHRTMFMQKFYSNCEGWCMQVWTLAN